MIRMGATAHTSCKRRWAGLKKQPDVIENIQEMKRGSKYYDPSASRTRRRRQAVLRDFEHFAHEYLEFEENTVWDSTTIIDSRMEYFAGLASISKGVLQEKVKVGTLYQAKYAFYWWNALFLDDFGTIYHKWHVTLMKWIHQVATDF
jgi:hypothetical protein